VSRVEYRRFLRLELAIADLGNGLRQGERGCCLRLVVKQSHRRLDHLLLAANVPGYDLCDAAFQLR
jgi:hypothetical protein